MNDIALTDRGQALHLSSDRLAVELAAPGTVYRGTRFDWTGFITQVTLDGAHTFCVPESLDPGQGTGGIGLCNEFGIEQAIGYDEAAPGEAFPKLGIGLLTRPDETPYRFARPYEIAQPYPIHVEAVADRATITVDPIDCRGYAARLLKTTAVRENELTVAYALENVGTRRIATREYAHNFVGIDGHSLGPDYNLRMPYPIALEEMPRIPRHVVRRFLPPLARKLAPGFVLDWLQARMIARQRAILNVEGNQFSLRTTPERPFYGRFAGYGKSDEAQWSLTHLPSGVAVAEYDDFCPVRVAVWGTAHVISAEVFCPVDVGPGETQTWTRRYVFST